MPLPTLVVVTGAPGAGKTRLAHALAAAIGCPAICRDEIKEGMVLAHGQGFAPARGDALTQRTFSLFLSVIRLLLEGGVSLVAEAAFQDRVWRSGLEPLLSLATLRIIHCDVADDVAQRRRIERASQPTRAAHADADPDIVSPSTFRRITLSAPSLVVDTTDGYRPALDEIARFARGS